MSAQADDQFCRCGRACPAQAAKAAGAIGFLIVRYNREPHGDFAFILELAGERFFTTIFSLMAAVLVTRKAVNGP